MKILVTIYAVAMMMFAVPVIVAAALIDSFDYGTTTGSATDNFALGSTSNAGINAELPNSDNTRYWYVFATGGSGVTGSISTITTPGSAVLTHTGPGTNPAVGVTLQYQFGSTGTNLSSYATLNILGSSGSGTGQYEISVWDSDGTKGLTNLPLNGSFNSFFIDLSTLALDPQNKGTIPGLDLTKVTSIYLYAMPTSGFSHTINEINVAPVPIPAAAWLLGSGLIGLVAIRRRFKK
jgi:hypothetical protein